jgi:tetratricopeptide (TPR) repeat protein
MPRIALIPAILAGAAALALAASAQAGAVTVLGGGLARDCSVATLKGGFSSGVEDICTQALDSEVMSARDRAATHVNRGVLKLRRAEYAEARFDFDRAVSLKPDLAEAYMNRGAAAIGARRYAESMADLNRALKLGVEEPEKAYYNRAMAFEALNDIKAAYFDYQKAAELSPMWDAPKRQLTRFTVERR